MFQYTPDHALLFCSQGVYEFEQLSHAGPFTGLNYNPSDPHSSIWALIDLGLDLVQPADVFVERSPFFVVEATSPRSDRLDWTGGLPPRFFYMNPWEFPEVAKAYADLLLRRHNANTYVSSSRTLVRSPPGERALWYLHKNYAAPPWMLFEYASDPERYIAVVRTAVNSTEDLARTLTCPDHVTSTSHFVVLLEPSSADRSTPQARIVT